MVVPNVLQQRFIQFLCALVFLCVPGLAATSQTTPARELVQEVVRNEIAANQNDHSHWMYRDIYRSPSKNIVKLVIETSDGSLSRTVEMNGRPLTQQERELDQARMQKVVDDPSVRAKQRKNSAHDSEQATALMRMLPDAFIWTEAGESNGDVTLNFRPNPSFQPPTYASRIFAAMAGTMVVDAQQKRLKILDGKLIQPVEFGWGILGKMQPGGTVQIVRSQVAPHEWEITQTHVHIEGHALFFKSISEQEDEITSDYKPTPASLSLQQAAAMLTDGAAAKEIESPSAK